MTDAGHDRVTIGEFARASGLTARALRLYDELGLLAPADVDDVTGYRYYDREQLDRARLVARLRLVGVPLDRIREVADADPVGAAAALTSYWRQAEADTATRRELVRALVVELSTTSTGKEHHMTTDTTFTTLATGRPETAVRAGIGGRDTQEDAHRVGDALFAVADGVGASRGVAAVALAALTEPTPGGDTVAELDDAVTRAAAAVATAYGDDTRASTTLTAVVLTPGRAVLAHVGDSRAYLVRDGSLSRLTRDHTVVQTLVDEGRLTAEEARTDDRRVVLNRALAAGAPYAPDLAVHVTRPGDRLVLTTDGVHGRLEPGDLATLLLAEASPDDVAASVEDAVEAVGADDNYVVLVVDLLA